VGLNNYVNLMKGRNMSKAKVGMVVILLLVMFVTGCQTVAGLGEDITWTAETTADLAAEQATGVLKANMESSNKRNHKSHDH